MAKEVGSNYFNFGTFLLNDANGNATQALEYQYQRNAEKINRVILTDWLQGKGAKPVAWFTLIDVLRKISLHQLADEIEEVHISLICNTYLADEVKRTPYTCISVTCIST